MDGEIYPYVSFLCTIHPIHPLDAYHSFALRVHLVDS